jgi:hypothetical protein
MKKTTHTLRPGPEQIFTGLGRRACDGAVLEVDFEQDGEEPEVAVKARLIELHDLNIAERRSEREVAWFLKRCLSRIRQEGLTLIIDQQVHYLPPEHIEVEQIRYRQFCTPPTEAGPFQ